MRRHKAGRDTQVSSESLLPRRQARISITIAENKQSKPPITVEPNIRYYGWFCFLNAFCCLWPFSYFANNASESPEGNLVRTLKEVRRDRKSAEAHEQKLEELGLSNKVFNRAICYPLMTPKISRQDAKLETKTSMPKVKIEYAGHASFIIWVGGYAILVDPAAGSPNNYICRRKIPPYFTTQRIKELMQKIAFIAVSHNHTDHNGALQDPAFKEAKPPIITGANSTWPGEWGYQKLHTLAWGQTQTVTINDNITVNVTGIPAQHDSARRGRGCCGYGVPTGVFNRELWLGFFFEITVKDKSSTEKKFNIYYTGDTGVGECFTDSNGKSIFLQQYIIKLAKQRGGVDIILSEVGPCEPSERYEGEHEKHMNAQKLVPFLSGIIQELKNAKIRVPDVIPVHHSTFPHSKPRGWYLIQFFLLAFEDPVVRERVIPLAVGGIIDLAKYRDTTPKIIGEQFKKVVLSAYRENSIFTPKIRTIYGIPEKEGKLTTSTPLTPDNAQLMFFSKRKELAVQDLAGSDQKHQFS